MTITIIALFSQKYNLNIIFKNVYFLLITKTSLFYFLQKGQNKKYKKCSQTKCPIIPDTSPSLLGC